jgi:hypothetical protein
MTNVTVCYVPGLEELNHSPSLLRFFHQGSRLLLCLPIAFFLLLGSSVCAEEWKVLSDQQVPPALVSPADVRWKDDSTILVVDRYRGVFELSIQTVAKDPKRVLESSLDRQKKGIWLPSRLAISSPHLAVASEIFQVSWVRRGFEAVIHQQLIESVTDIDLFEKDLAVLGLRRDGSGELASDGAIAWIGRLEGSTVALKPVLYSSRGKGAPPMDRCFSLGLGAIRFLTNGSVVIVPGSEPGVFQIAPNGSLEQAWNTEDLRIYAHCDLTDAQVLHFSADLGTRLLWINSRRVVDEILEINKKPSLLVREIVDDRPTWKLAILEPSGIAILIPLPLSTGSERARIKADVRGNKVVLLVHDVFLMMGEAHRETPRLIVMEIPSGKGAKNL